MKKIGILTFHYSHNYGGVLQAFALQNTLKKYHKDYQIDIIDFVPKSYKNQSIFGILKLRKNLFKNSIKDLNPKTVIIRLLRHIRYYKKLSIEFNKFRDNYMSFSKHANEDNFLVVISDYDVIVVGSDQIWNPSQRLKPYYFLNFIDYYGSRISYAADSTFSNVSNDEKEYLKPALTRFKYISVRNTHSQSFVNKITSQNPIIVCDPTFLQDFSCISVPKKLNKGYILCYIIGKEIKNGHKAAISRIKQYKGNKPVYLIRLLESGIIDNSFADRVFYNISPLEWVYLIENADFVYTDSYHGVLFSIKYNKDFLAYYTEVERASRFVELSTNYGLQDVIVQSLDDYNNSEINYIDIKSKLNKEIESSLKFIKDMI